MPISTQWHSLSFTPFPPHHLASSFAPISPPHIFWPHCMVWLWGRQFAWVTSRHPALSGCLTTSQIMVLWYCLNTSPILIDPLQRCVSIDSILIDCMQGFLSTSSLFTLVKVVLKRYRIRRASASARTLCPFPEYRPLFQNTILIVSEDPDGYGSVSEGPDDYRMVSRCRDK
jgi:hypothetical protein